jgi:hypothetical protein
MYLIAFILSGMLTDHIRDGGYSVGLDTHWQWTCNMSKKQTFVAKSH